MSGFAYSVPLWLNHRGALLCLATLALQLTFGFKWFPSIALHEGSPPAAEVNVGPWLPEPIVNDPALAREKPETIADAVSLPLMLALERYGSALALVTI